MLGILAVGKDLSLLLTRAAVLRGAGAEVDVATPARLEAMMESRRYGLLVLCHTLSPAERAAITEMVGQRWSGVRVLQLVRERWMEEPMVGVTAISTPEPRRLVGQVITLLGDSRAETVVRA
jgi:hypothetical protein